MACDVRKARLNRMENNQKQATKRLDSYNRIKKQEFAELRRMSATESLRRGLALIAEVAKWKK